MQVVGTPDPWTAAECSQWVGGGKGVECPLDSEKLPKIRKKRGEIGNKIGKSGKFLLNREDKANIGIVFSLCPS